MTAVIKEKMNKNIEILKIKAAILDELLELLEDKHLGYIMQDTEKEKNISFSKAKKMLHS